MADTTLAIVEGIAQAMRAEFGAERVHDHGDDVQGEELPAVVVATPIPDAPETELTDQAGIRRLIVTVTVVDRTPALAADARGRALAAIRELPDPEGSARGGRSLGNREIGRGAGATALYAESLEIRVLYSDAALDVYA